MQRGRPKGTRISDKRTEKVKQKADDPWVIAGQQTLQRVNPRGKAENLDPGVNFFVLALEELGAETVWSCEGHPEGFYVTFRSSLELAQRIKSVGYFRVEIERPGEFSIRLRDLDRASSGDWVPWTDANKNRVLRWAASAWKEKLLT